MAIPVWGGVLIAISVIGSVLFCLYILIKGFTICATGTPSIPSRYLTIITSNSEKRGFQQTAKRFQHDLVCNHFFFI